MRISGGHGQASQRMAPPVFVLAPPRSFSTVFASMIGQHPQLYGLPEIHLFGAESVGEFLHQCAEATYNMADGIIRAVAQLCFGSQTAATALQARGWLARRGHFSTGLLFEMLGRRACPLALVDKSPSLVYRPESLARVHQLFPDARYLHLVRHPIGHGSSVLNYIELRARDGAIPSTHWLLQLASFPYSFGDETNDVPPGPDPQRGWYALNSNICQFLAGLPADRWLRVRGEEVLGDPDRFLPGIATWLGLRSDAQAIDEMKHPERSPYSCHGPPGAKFGNDRLFLLSPALRPERAAERRLDELPSWLHGKSLNPAVSAMARSFGYT